MAKYTYNGFINVNNAPRQADGIGVYDSNDQLVGIIPFSSEMNLKHKTTEPIYSFGLLSDIHLDTTDYNYSQYLNTYPYSDEGEGDFRRALQWFKNHENIKMVCACGDLSQSGTASEFAMPQSVIASELPPSGNIPFFTCTGNHDVKTARGNGFGNYFLRDFEKTWNGMSNFERSSAFNESFSFDIVSRGASVGQFVDHFIFFSMYTYSLGSSASPYNDNDINWLISKLESYKNERTFIFTHLFFPDLAGNLGRINGGGGIYPSGNWLGGTQLTRLTSLLLNRPNCIWFSGHSHWKWDLQKYQINVNIDRSEYNSLKKGAWHVHVPSCALPIDSDYSSTSSQTEKSREEKPLESQGGVVDVYENEIVIRGIDFNINTSQNGATTQGFSGDTYVKYLPIACYTLDTTTQYISSENADAVLVVSENLKISTGSSHPSGQTVVFNTNENDDSIIVIDFNRSSQSCVLTDTSLTSDATAFRVFCDEANVELVFNDDRESINVPLSEIDDYFGWLISYETEGNISHYGFSKTFNYTHNLGQKYSGYTYGVSENAEFIGVQLNTSSKLASTSTPCWLDNYVTAEDRTSFKTTASTFHIVVTFTNLRIENIGGSGEGGGSTDTGDTPSTVTVEYYDWSEINSMNVDDEIEVVMANPHKTSGYILGHNGTNAVSNGNGFATLDDMSTAVASVSGNDNYNMIITKKQDTREETTTTDVARTFTVSGTFNNTALAKIASVKVNGYDAYGVSASTLATTSRTANTNITFDGTELPRTIYAKLYVSNTKATATATISNGGTGTIIKTNNKTFTSTSNYASISMTSNTLTISTTVRGNETVPSATWIILIPTGVTETVNTTTQVPGDIYYTLKSKVGSYSPSGTTAAASWSTTPMHYTIENATSLASSSDLTSGISASNNTKLIRFKNPSDSYLNAGGGLSSLKYATGTGEWSVWYLGKAVVEDWSDYVQKASIDYNSNKHTDETYLNDYVQDLPNGYVAISFNKGTQGFKVTPPNGTTTLQVDDLKVYRGMNVTSGTEIALPQYVGFFSGNGYTGAARYQIVSGFKPSLNEDAMVGQAQFQTSSSYTGGEITIVMKVKFV